MVVGGSATVWQAITLRMLPQDFKTRTLYGYGEDWPLAYDDLEPYYGKAEALLGYQARMPTTRSLPGDPAHIPFHRSN